jgi:hypothetical protein
MFVLCVWPIAPFIFWSTLVPIIYGIAENPSNDLVFTVISLTILSFISLQIAFIIDSLSQSQVWLIHQIHEYKLFYL